MAFLRVIQIPFGVVSGRAAGIKLKSNVELLAVVTPRDKSLHMSGGHWFPFPMWNSIKCAGGRKHDGHVLLGIHMTVTSFILIKPIFPQQEL